MPLQQPVESTSSTMYDISEVVNKLTILKEVAHGNMVTARKIYYDAKRRKDGRERDYQYGLEMAYSDMVIRLEDILKELGQ